MIALSQQYPRLTSDIGGYMETFGRQLEILARMMGIDPRDSSIDRKMRQHHVEIVQIVREVRRNHPDLFESQRRGIGEGHKLQGDILLAMKEAVAMRITDPTLAIGIEREIMDTFRNLLHVDMPEDQFWIFKAQTGQEIAELHFHNTVLFGTLFEGTPPAVPALADSLQITPQSWLAGLADSIGELSKTLLTFLTDYDVPPEAELRFELRFVRIGQTIIDFLNLYIARYPMVIDNSRRRDWGSRFRGMVTRAENNIKWERDRIRLLRTNH
jgi:hypothetical protein